MTHEEFIRRWRAAGNARAERIHAENVKEGDKAMSVRDVDNEPCPNAWAAAAHECLQHEQWTWCRSEFEWQIALDCLGWCLRDAGMAAACEMRGHRLGRDEGYQDGYNECEAGEDL